MNVFDRIIHFISKYLDEINKYEKLINEEDHSTKKDLKPERYREFSLNTYF